MNTFYDSAPVQLWTARPNGELDHVNATVVAYFGQSHEHILEWGWAELVHPDDLPEVGERWSGSLESGEPYSVHFRLLRHDGEYLWHLGQAEARRGETSQIEGWVGANTNIHDLVER